MKSSKPLLLVIDEIDGATGAGDNVSALFYYSFLVYLMRVYGIVWEFRSQTGSIDVRQTQEEKFVLLCMSSPKPNLT